MNENHSNRQSLRFHAFVFCAITILCFLPLWHFYGHSWHYWFSDVLNYVFEDSVIMNFATQPEILPLSVRVFYTLAVASILSAFITWLIYAWRHDYASRPADV